MKYITILAAISMSISAYGSSFWCTVKDFNAGPLTQDFYTDAIGKEFHVNRSTGRIYGGLDNSVLDSYTPKVVSDGSNSYYKSISGNVMTYFTVRIDKNTKSHFFVFV
ncbi:hypothetical protein [Microbulbifer sp. JTAC008]|uniref:hypothetical protein n=1 Tax=Microbulbifer sp. JTAC008 TaxID=3243374 RepID=UPI00403A186D